jgi:acetyl-CoA decarbonylase/synthase complex subunit gamma
MEATIAATLMNKYADVLIFHGTEIGELIPVLTLRQGKYTDPKSHRLWILDSMSLVN